MKDLVVRKSGLPEKAASRQQNKTKPRPYGLTYRIWGIGWCIIIIFLANRHNKYTQEGGYGSVPSWFPHCQCRYSHHTCMCHKYHVKHTSKRCNIDRLKMFTTVKKYILVPSEWGKTRKTWIFFHRNLSAFASSGSKAQYVCIVYWIEVNLKNLKTTLINRTRLRTKS